ncbi:MAG: glycosyltransferase, partial [Clostridia bacterium]
SLRFLIKFDIISAMQKTTKGRVSLLIGQFCETYPPALDGVGRVMLAYCQTLEQMGHRCLYIAPLDTDRTLTTDCETLLYTGMPIPGERYRIGVPGWSRGYRKAARELPFDLVHIHSPFLAGRAARRIARRRHIPMVATFHSKFYDDFYRATHSVLLSKLALRYVLALYRSCDEVWAVNAKTAQVLRDYGYEGEIVIMPNGTNPQSVTEDEYADAMARFPLREGIPTFLFVGQLDIKKNTESILRACALIQQRGIDFQLLMVGCGQDEQRLRTLSRQLGLEEKVSFTGFLGDRSQTLSLYRRADLLVFPSVYDNAPMVVREAAAMGTPALLVEGTCSAEGVVHGENGFLCQNTVESIAEGILNALPAAKEVGERARQTIPIPWDRIMSEVVMRYNQLCAQKRGTKRQTAGRRRVSSPRTHSFSRGKRMGGKG